jgi:ribose 1,5-bisphosphokinase PhnN
MDAPVSFSERRADDEAVELVVVEASPEIGAKGDVREGRESNEAIILNRCGGREQDAVDGDGIPTLTQAADVAMGTTI